jgi:hypothetical protein
LPLNAVSEPQIFAGDDYSGTDDPGLTFTLENEIAGGVGRTTQTARSPVGALKLVYTIETLPRKPAQLDGLTLVSCKATL